MPPKIIVNHLLILVHQILDYDDQNDQDHYYHKHHLHPSLRRCLRRQREYLLVHFSLDYLFALMQHQQ